MIRGFTLIELLVSVAIFTVVMVIALGSLLSMVESDRKAQTLKTITNNLNFTVDSISRGLRTGYTYHCDSVGSLTTPRDCSNGASYIVYHSAEGTAGLGDSPITNAYVAYCRGSGTSCDVNGVSILRSYSTDGGSSWSTWASITAPEVVVTALTFYVVGSASGDTLQPRVTILLRGYVQVTAALRSNFDLQTTVTQRIYDQ